MLRKKADIRKYDSIYVTTPKHQNQSIVMEIRSMSSSFAEGFC
jgi:hypothetical protein